MEKKHSKAPLFIGMSIVAVLAVVIAVIIIARTNSPKNLLQDQLNLGYRYLEELNYEQAVAAFEAAIEIDPRNIEGYNGLVNAYAGQGNADGFLSVYELANTNLTSDETDLIRKSIVVELDKMINEATADGNRELADELIEILKQIAPEEAEKYTLTNPATEEDDESEEITDLNPYIIKSERSDGVVFTYEYDDAGNMICKSGSDGTWTVYEYDAFGQCIKYEESYGAGGEFQYDSEGRVVKNSLGRYDSGNLEINMWEEYVYDENGILVNYITSYRPVSRFETDDWGNLTYKEYEDGGWTRCEYDLNNNEIFSTDSSGNIFEMTYDENGVLRIFSQKFHSDTPMYTYYDMFGNEIFAEDLFYTNTYSDGTVLTYDNSKYEPA